MTIELKKANALEICEATEALVATINSKPELWFGGSPPLFISLSNALNSSSTLMRQKFELSPVNNPNEVPALT